MAARKLEDGLVHAGLVHIDQALLQGVVALDVVEARGAGGLLDHDLALAGRVYGNAPLGVVLTGNLGEKLLA